MAKNNVRDWDATASNNTDIAGIGIQGSNLPSNFDNALRTVMAQVAAVDAGTDPVNDTWSFCDPADTTKIFRLDAGSITTATTRVITVPNVSSTMAVLGLAQTFTQAQTMPALTVSGSAPIISLTDTDTGADHTISGSSSFGNFTISVDANSEVVGSAFGLTVRGTSVLTIDNTSATLSVDLLPGANNTYDIGAAASRFTNGEFAGVVSVTTSTSGSIPAFGSVSNVTGAWINQAGAVQVSRDNATGIWQRQASDGQVHQFYRGTSVVGSISVTAAATTYNTSSDGRLKANRRPISNAAAVIDGLEPVTYDWTHVQATGVGFIAQDVYQLIPEAVLVGDSDPNKAPGDAGFEQWAMDYSKIVPYLVAELKAVRARLAALESSL